MAGCCAAQRGVCRLLEGSKGDPCLTGSLCQKKKKKCLQRPTLPDRSSPALSKHLSRFARGKIAILSFSLFCSTCQSETPWLTLHQPLSWQESDPSMNRSMAKWKSEAFWVKCGQLALGERSDNEPCTSRVLLFLQQTCGDCVNSWGSQLCVCICGYRDRTICWHGSVVYVSETCWQNFKTYSLYFIFLPFVVFKILILKQVLQETCRDSEKRAKTCYFAH